jgi:hypothetical protein
VLYSTHISICGFPWGPTLTSLSTTRQPQDFSESIATLCKTLWQRMLQFTITYQPCAARCRTRSVRIATRLARKIISKHRKRNRLNTSRCRKSDSNSSMQLVDSTTRDQPPKKQPHSAAPGTISLPTSLIPHPHPLQHVASIAQSD